LQVFSVINLCFLPYYILLNHGYEPQNKLWKQIPQQAEGFYTLLMLDNSTCKLQFTLFLMLGYHYNLPIPLRRR